MYAIIFYSKLFLAWNCVTIQQIVNSDWQSGNDDGRCACTHIVDGGRKRLRWWLSAQQSERKWMLWWQPRGVDSIAEADHRLMTSHSSSCHRLATNTRTRTPRPCTRVYMLSNCGKSKIMTCGLLSCRKTHSFVGESFCFVAYIICLVVLSLYSGMCCLFWVLVIFVTVIRLIRLWMG